MNKRNVIPGLFAVVLGLSAAYGDGILLDGAKNTNLPWTVNDSKGFRWDIQYNGCVGDGSNDAYDTGMRLYVNGASFSWSSSISVDKAGTEVQLGPWQYSSIRVYRRIYVDKKRGYCRWVDIFENTQGNPYNLNLRYHVDVGGSIRRTFTTTGKSAVTNKDWGIATTYSDSSSRPSTVHVFCSKDAEVRPQVSTSGDNIYYNFSLSIPAGKKMALCFFEAQRKPFAKAQGFLKSFSPSAGIRDLPRELRDIIQNISGSSLSLGSLKLPRSDEHDLAVRNNDDEMLGKFLIDELALETAFGKITLPAERILGLAMVAPRDRYALVALTDGQIVGGKMQSKTLKFRLTNGSQLELEPQQFKTIAFQISTGKPDEIEISDPMVLLRGGQQLIFSLDDLDCTYQTRYGRVKLTADSLSQIVLTTEDGGLHRAEFLNGTVLSGMLGKDEQELTLALMDKKCSIPHPYIQLFAIQPATEATPPLVEVAMANDDTLNGWIMDEEIKLKTDVGKITLTPGQMRDVEFSEGTMGHMRCTLADGSAVTGYIENKRLRFLIAEGVELPIHTGHIRTMQIPEKLPKEGDLASEDDSADPDETDRPENGTVSSPDLQKLRDELKQLQEVQKKLEAISAAGGGEAVKAEMEKVARQIAEIKVKIARAEKEAQAKAAR
ncbi:MAG: hypothetical protein ACLFVU_12240, partial [Phycisphaerae bacterium]